MQTAFALFLMSIVVGLPIVAEYRDRKRKAKEAPDDFAGIPQTMAGPLE